MKKLNSKQQRDINTTQNVDLMIGANAPQREEVLKQTKSALSNIVDSTSYDHTAWAAQDFADATLEGPQGKQALSAYLMPRRFATSNLSSAYRHTVVRKLLVEVCADRLDALRKRRQKVAA